MFTKVKLFFAPINLDDLTVTWHQGQVELMAYRLGKVKLLFTGTRLKAGDVVHFSERKK